MILLGRKSRHKTYAWKEAPDGARVRRRVAAPPALASFYTRDTRRGNSVETIYEHTSRVWVRYNRGDGRLNAGYKIDRHTFEFYVTRNIVTTATQEPWAQLQETSMATESGTWL